MRLATFIGLVMLLSACGKKNDAPVTPLFEAMIDGVKWQANTASAVVLPPNSSSAPFRITATNATGQSMYLRSADPPATTLSFRTTPATLGSFAGTFNRNISNYASLNWSTLNEVNLARFEIQRSNDGHNFIVAGSVNATGNSTTQVNYTFSDKPGSDNLFTGRVYYRLNAVDTDNKQAYSQIIVINLVSAAMFQYAAGGGDHGFGKTGSVTITSIDREKKRISGNFSFAYRDDRTGTDHTVSNGVFQHIPYQ